MDFRIHLRQGVAPCTPVGQRPDGYGFIYLVGAWGAIIPVSWVIQSPDRKQLPETAVAKIVVEN